MKRYTQRIKQYSVNKLFNQDQKRKYQELNEKKNNDNSVLDANESKVFWPNIWSIEKSHDTKAERLQLLKKEKGYYHPDDLKITDKMIASQCRKLLNCIGV